MTEQTTIAQREILVGIPDAAEQLGIHVQTVRRWITDGILPARRFGPKRIKIRQADIDALIAGTPLPTPNESQQ